MKRLAIALGLTLMWEALWAGVLFLVTWLLVKKLWIAENFLHPLYLAQRSSVELYTNDLVEQIISASITIFGIGLICSVAWHVIGAFSRIYGPGYAAKLLWIWLLILVLGAASSSGAVYWYVGLSGLALFSGMVQLYAAGFLLFILSYYIGTVFSTAPKLRPAVPLARYLPAV